MRPTKEVACQQFYRRWLTTALQPAWSGTDTLATVLGLIIPPASRLFPKLSGPMTALGWQIPVCAFAILALVRFVRAPYLMQIDDEATSKAQRAELARLRRQPPNIKIAITDIVATQTSYDMNVFVRASMELKRPQSVDVTYALQLIGLGGKVNVGAGEPILGKGIARVLMSRVVNGEMKPISDMVHAMHPLETSLDNQHKFEGWLHFVLPSCSPRKAGQMDRVRLTAVSEFGCASADASLRQRGGGSSALERVHEYIVKNLPSGEPAPSGLKREP
jgi:hypothetical protein